MVKRCPSCGYFNPDDATFCSSCGSALIPIPWNEGKPKTPKEGKRKASKKGKRKKTAKRGIMPIPWKTKKPRSKR